MNQDKKPTEIIVDPKRVDVLPPEATIEYEEEVKPEGQGPKSQEYGHLHVLSTSWFARVLCLIFFLLSLAGLAFSLIVFLGCSFYALIRLLTGDPQWADTLKTFAFGLASGLIFSFCFLVGVFSPGWALCMGIAYISFAKNKLK